MDWRILPSEKWIEKTKKDQGVGDNSGLKTFFLIFY